MIRRVLFLAALLASAPSWSAVTLSQFPPNPGVLPGGGWRFTSGTTFADPPPARAWTNGVYGGVAAAVATDRFSLKGPAAGALSVAVATSATVPNIAAALARVAARASGPLSVGMVAYDLLSSQGVRQGEGGAEIDFGSDEVSVSGECWKADNICYPSPLASWVSWHPVGETYSSTLKYGSSSCTKSGTWAANCKTELISSLTGLSTGGFVGRAIAPPYQSVTAAC